MNHRYANQISHDQYITMTGLFICWKCNTIYNDPGQEGIDSCTQPGCEETFNSLNYIDDLIAPTIELLNKKGYYTAYCCSGHIKDNSCRTYIYFKGPLEPHMINLLIKHLPKDYFSHEVDSKSLLTIRDKKLPEAYSDSLIERIRELIERIRELAELNIKLYEWAQSLPCLPYESF